MPGKISAQMMVFVLGGILSAAVDIGITVLLLRSSVAYPLAISIGFAAGLGINFLFHARVTFRALIEAASAARFLTVVALNYGITLAMVWLFHQVLGQSVLFGKVLSLPIVATVGFVLSRIWVFTARSEGLDD